MNKPEKNSPTPAEILKSILGTDLKSFNLNSEDVEQISSSLKPLTLEKNEIFCKKGYVCDRVPLW